jgi:hypothetical protein
MSPTAGASGVSFPCGSRLRANSSGHTLAVLSGQFRPRRSVLARPEDLIRGPLPLRRDSAARLGGGFTVRDGNYLSARWPGDAHRFASEFAAMIG